MVLKLLRFYQDNVTSYGLVFRHFRRHYLALKTSFFVSMFLLPLLAVYASRGALVCTLLGLALLSLDAFLYVSANKKAKAVLSDKYGITPARFLWRTGDFAELQVKEFSAYLAEHGLRSPESIDMLIELFERQVAKRKHTPYVAPAIIAAVLIPVWVRLLDSLFSNLGAHADAWPLAVTIIMLVLFVFYGWGFIKRQYDEVRTTFFPDSIIQMLNLIELLYECRIAASREKKWCQIGDRHVVPARCPKHAGAVSHGL